LRNCFTILVILSSLLIQACATTNVVTTTIPGKELSRTSLGVREIDNRVMMEEIDPLSVKLYRRVSTVEYTKSVFQAVNETRHEKTTYDCRSAYDRYPAFLITTFGVPLLFEMATGFDVLRGMCDKNPPTSIIETVQTDKTLTEESFDKDKIVTRETPIAGEPVTVEIEGNKFVVSTSTAGIATIPEKEVLSLNDSEKSRSIDYQYNDVRLATPFKKRDQQKEALAAMSPAKSTSMDTTSDDSSASSRAVTTDNTPAAKKSALWESRPDDAPVVKRSASWESQPESKPDSIAMTGDQSAAIKSANENKRQGQENSSSNLNTVARQMRKTTVTPLESNNRAQNTSPTTVNAGTGFISGANVAGSGAAATTGMIAVVNAATIMAPVTVAAGATTGTSNVTATNSAKGTGTGKFTVNASPTVASTSPNNIAQNTGPTTETITSTTIISDASVPGSGAEVTTGAATAVNTATITAPVTVAAGTTTGAGNVTVTNSAKGTGTGEFTVNAVPTVTSTSPNNLAKGTGPTTETITGTIFVSDANVPGSGTGVTSGAATAVNAATITAPVTMAAGTTTGADNATVINTDTSTGNGVFTANASPTVTSTSPNNLAKGTGPTIVTITGTGFVSGVTVAFNGTEVTTGAITVVNATTITAPVTVATGATTGARNVTVANSDGGTGTGVGVFSVTTAVARSEQGNLEKSLGSVNNYADNKVSEDIEATAGMKAAAIEGMVARPDAATVNETSVSLGSESTPENSRTGEWKIILHVKFDTNKATIKKEYFSRLEEIGETLRENPRLKGVIEGHTDNVGSAKINQRLSIRRAEAVAQHLIKTYGISSDRIKIEGFGMSRPLADNATPKGRAINRRIEAKFKNLSSSSITSTP
jgi:outer membrane protein OmpA-like peptidoglycan-associated protein